MVSAIFLARRAKEEHEFPKITIGSLRLGN